MGNSCRFCFCAYFIHIISKLNFGIQSDILKKKKKQYFAYLNITLLYIFTGSKIVYGNICILYAVIPCIIF